MDGKNSLGSEVFGTKNFLGYIMQSMAGCMLEELEVRPCGSMICRLVGGGPTNSTIPMYIWIQLKIGFFIRKMHKVKIGSSISSVMAGIG